MALRRKISASLATFLRTANRLKALEADSRKRLSTAPRRPKIGTLSIIQLEVVEASIFFELFRSYEIFIEEVFILYCMGKSSLSGNTAQSYIAPKSYWHAVDMIKSSQNFLDWTTPDTVVSRSELYLKDGEPIKSVYTANMNLLRNLKRLRNHHAHNSRESYSGYLKVLQNELKAVPPNELRIGQFLLMPDKLNPHQFYIQKYIGEFEKLANLIAN